jgi:hypothetical protein
MGNGSALRQEAHVLAELVREGEILKRNAVDRILNAGVAFGVADSAIYEILNSEFSEFNRDFMDTQRSEYPTLGCAASRRSTYPRCYNHEGIPHSSGRFNACLNMSGHPFGVEVDEAPRGLSRSIIDEIPRSRDSPGVFYDFSRPH